MPVDQKIAVRGVFVLADSGLDDRRVLERRKSERRIVARSFGDRRGDDARLSVGINRFSVMVRGDLQAALVAGGHAEEENLLPAREDARAQQRGKNLAEPRTAGKDERPSRDGFAATGFDADDAAGSAGCFHLRNAVRDAATGSV